TSLHKDLVESRWGRCALIKEGVETKLMHLPWTWNPQTYIAYAPGISFFKRNESYAHGGISIHECLTPIISIHPKTTYTVSKGEIQNIQWRGMRLYVHTSGANEQFKIDIRTKSSDSSSSIIFSHSL